MQKITDAASQQPAPALQAQHKCLGAAGKTTRSPFFPNNQNGAAIVIAVMLSLIVFMLMAVGGQLISTSHQSSKTQQKVLTEADNVARAGLVDAIAWFKRQSQQPVSATKLGMAYPDAAFYPRHSATASASSTIDEDIGLVKEYELSSDGKRWARYEVVRQSVDPGTDVYNSHAVHDISNQRIEGAKAGDGYVWYIESIGYVYQRNNAGAAYNVAPNHVIAKVRASTEIRRLMLKQPSQAAYVTKQITGSGSSKNVAVFKSGRIIGGANIGVAWSTSTVGGPYLDSAGTISGTPAYSSYLSNDPTPYNVFGVTQSDLKLVSDNVVSSTVKLSTSMADMSITFVDGNAVFSSTQPLGGSGVLFVNGNLTIQAASNIMYSGMVYVTGKATILEPTLISGQVIAYNGLSLSRSAATDVAEIDYDSTMLNSVNQQICQYRENKSTLHVFIGVPELEQ